jgi:hypothetical protein
MPELPWAGFAPLRKGKIHVFCPRCHRKISNAERDEYDPPRATLVHTWCDRCGEGGKDSPEHYFDARGREISYEEVERNIDRICRGKEAAPDHAFLGGYEVDPSQPRRCQLCGKDWLEHGVQP